MISNIDDPVAALVEGADDQQFWALVSLIETGAPHLRELAAAVLELEKTSWPGWKTLATWILAQWAEREPQPLETVGRSLTQLDPVGRPYVTLACSALGARAVPLLVAGLEATDAGQRFAAANALFNLGPEASLPALVTNVTTGAPLTRAVSACTLAAFGPKATSSVGTILPLLQGQTQAEVIAALILCGCTGGDPRGFSEPIAEIARRNDISSELRLLAWLALGQVQGGNLHRLRKVLADLAPHRSRSSPPWAPEALRVVQSLILDGQEQFRRHVAGPPELISPAERVVECWLDCATPDPRWTPQPYRDPTDAADRIVYAWHHCVLRPRVAERPDGLGYSWGNSVVRESVPTAGALERTLWSTCLMGITEWETDIRYGFEEDYYVPDFEREPWAQASRDDPTIASIELALRAIRRWHCARPDTDLSTRRIQLATGVLEPAALAFVQRRRSKELFDALLEAGKLNEDRPRFRTVSERQLQALDTLLPEQDPFAPACVAVAGQGDERIQALVMPHLVDKIRSCSGDREVAELGAALLSEIVRRGPGRTKGHTNIHDVYTSEFISAVCAALTRDPELAHRNLEALAAVLRIASEHQLSTLSAIARLGERAAPLRGRVEELVRAWLGCYHSEDAVRIGLETLDAIGGDPLALALLSFHPPHTVGSQFRTNSALAARAWIAEAAGEGALERVLDLAAHDNRSGTRAEALDGVIQIARRVDPKSTAVLRSAKRLRSLCRHKDVGVSARARIALSFFITNAVEDLLLTGLRKAVQDDEPRTTEIELLVERILELIAPSDSAIVRQVVLTFVDSWDMPIAVTTVGEAALRPLLALIRWRTRSHKSQEGLLNAMEALAALAPLPDLPSVRSTLIPVAQRRRCGSGRPYVVAKRAADLLQEAASSVFRVEVLEWEVEDRQDYYLEGRIDTEDVTLRCEAFRLFREGRLIAEQGVHAPWPDST